MEGSPQPIVIKRIVAGHGHHGGGWKVAFADFATAMMAFFLLMWLMGSTSAEQKGGISQYFKNPSVAQGVSPSPSPSAVQGPGGPSSSMIDMGGSTEQYKNPAPADAKEDEDPTKKAVKSGENEVVGDKHAQQVAEAKQAEQAETHRLETLKDGLAKAIDEQGSLKPFKDQILMDMTSEGLRIQIVDKENRSMFDLGAATLKDYSLSVLLELAKVIQKAPNRVSISGHTDYAKYVRQNYGNWELSTDRANAARRALIAGGLPEQKIGRVVGLASTALLDPTNPQNPINRRISIIVMNARTEQAIKQESASLFSTEDRDSSISGTMPVAGAATQAPATALIAPAITPVKQNDSSPATNPIAAATPTAASSIAASTSTTTPIKVGSAAPVISAVKPIIAAPVSNR